MKQKVFFFLSLYPVLFLTFQKEHITSVLKVQAKGLAEKLILPCETKILCDWLWSKSLLISQQHAAVADNFIFYIPRVSVASSHAQYSVHIAKN